LTLTAVADLPLVTECATAINGVRTLNHSLLVKRYELWSRSAELPS
jgi:hypothetical protein